GRSGGGSPWTRRGSAAGALRPPGPRAPAQVETPPYRLVTSGRTTGIRPRREDGLVRPLLPLWHEETVAYCEAVGIGHREDASNPDTVRGLIRAQILPLLRKIHPTADANLLRALEERRELPAALAELLDSRAGPKGPARGGGRRATRECDRLWLEAGPIPLEGPVRWGEWKIETELAGLKVRGWRPGDRLAGRRKKIQDVFVDAKIPRSEREAWPLVVRGDEVVAVPGIVEAEGIRAVRLTDLHAHEIPNAIRRRADMRGAPAANHEEGGTRGKHGFPRDSEPKAQRNADEIGSGGRRSTDRGERPELACRRARVRDLSRLRRPRPAPDRRPQRRSVLHGRPDAEADDPLRGRFHGDLELRRQHRLLGS